ncbi:hypothetical protein DRN74_01480 [Candidatus Micrarchaeota archaeon]|nr:MAG: hypothetical protein DRN74_01480 [Candidatus Micrarchaeota archaeon]
MVNVNYRRGYKLEYNSKKLLENAGWIVTRLPASKSPADLIAIKNGKTLLIQCKKTQKDSLYVYGLNTLREKAKKHGAIPVLVYGFGRSPAYAKRITGDKEKLKKSEKNTLLREFISLIAKNYQKR